MFAVLWSADSWFRRVRRSLKEGSAAAEKVAAAAEKVSGAAEKVSGEDFSWLVC